ncbi:MAG: ImmA/IrrE family metallo-endopeptidase [Hyphomicrobiaceae bacterium]
MDILMQRRLSQPTFAKQLGLGLDDVRRLTQGLTSIDSQLAGQLAVLLGPSKEFWLARERQFRERMHQDDLEEAQLSPEEWASQLPLKDMARFGWIGSTTSKKEAAIECLHFFEVPSVRAWHRKYRGDLSVAAFRTSPSFASNPAAVAAWLKKAEKLSREIACVKWDRRKFLAKVSELRKLTRQKDPARFIPELTSACAECGVALVILRAPSGCRASGATRFLTPERALIVLSFRYRSDDHFWFTFFHEAGHLLLHDMDALFLEDGSDVTANEEREANAFAEEVLVPPSARAELMAVRPSVNDIVRFARRLGISPGIVVGQMQHHGRIRRDRFNGLKRRFVWG